MSLSGKGMFIWKLPNCEGGNTERIMARAVRAGLSHVLVKIADGPGPYGDPGQINLLRRTLDDAGIQTWGWHYVYGNDPLGEARVAESLVKSYGLDGYVIDAEAPYKGRPGQATTFMRDLRAALPPTFPVALSSYRYPSLHRELPWAQFLDQAQYAMPQVYWEGAHDAGAQLERSVKEYMQLVGPAFEYVATGAAYGTGSWQATPADVHDFLLRARALGMAAVNFYSWDWAGAPGREALWDAIANFYWPPESGQGPGDVPPVEEPPTVGKVTAIVNVIQGDHADALRLLNQLKEQPGVIVTALTEIELPGLNEPPAPTPPQPAFVWPTEDAQRRVIQEFGANPGYYKQFDLPGHEGRDLVAPRGSKIMAVCAGRIARIDLNHAAYGVSVRQSCEVEGRTLEVCYAHGLTDSVKVKVGDEVQAGQVLMLSDATGNVFGDSADLSHLHLHVREPGKTYTSPEGVVWPFNVVDPRPFFGS